MEMHQRNTAANGKILNYISQTYLYPKNFDELLYCSQLLQPMRSVTALSISAASAVPAWVLLYGS